MCSSLFCLCDLSPYKNLLLLLYDLPFPVHFPFPAYYKHLCKSTVFITEGGVLVCGQQVAVWFNSCCLYWNGQLTKTISPNTFINLILAVETLIQHDSLMMVILLLFAIHHIRHYQTYGTFSAWCWSFCDLHVTFIMQSTLYTVYYIILLYMIQLLLYQKMGLSSFY